MTLLQTKIQNGQETSDRMSFQCLKATGESKRLVLTYMHVISQFLQVLHTFYSMQIIVVDKYSTLRWAASYYWTEALRFGFIKYQQSKICVFFFSIFCLFSLQTQFIFLSIFLLKFFFRENPIFRLSEQLDALKSFKSFKNPNFQVFQNITKYKKYNSKHNKI
jgi:hypothetical protein